MLGDILRREREKQGLTIKDIENETSIRSLYIEAIEKGDYDHLPSDVYTKGFIRNYAKALNMDSDPLLQQFNSERNIDVPVQPVDQRPQETYYDDVPQRTITVKSSSYSASGSEGGNLFSSGNDYRERTEEKGGSRKFMILLAMMVVFLGGVYYAFSDDPAQEKSKPTVKTEKVVDKKQEQPPVVEKKYDSVEVSAKFTDPCWISVKTDGKEVFEGTVDSGKEMSWKGNDKVELIAGNAGAIELTWNGKSLGVLGSKGQVVERLMTKESDGAKAKTADASKDEGTKTKSTPTKSDTSKSNKSAK